MGLLSRINAVFRVSSLTLEQERTLDQLQANRAKAVYLIPQSLWKEFLKTVFPDNRLKKIAIEVLAASSRQGQFGFEYLRGYIETCLGTRDFSARLVDNGVDPKRVAEAMLDKIALG